MEDDDQSKVRSEKMSTRKRQRENGSQTDEDSVLECGHCSADITRLETKIDKLLGLFSEIESLKVRLAAVEEDTIQLKDSANSREKELTDLKTSVGNTCARTANNTKEVQELKATVEELKCRNIKLEAYTRRENVKIFNLQEVPGETPQDTEELVRSMLVNNMNFSKEDVDDIRFERVHRMPSRRNANTNAEPRPVIAKFSFYQDKEYVWLRVKNLKGSGIGLSHDFPREIDTIHEKLYPVLKKAKKEKQSAFFQVDKLIINGQVYRGLETTNLPYYGKIMSSNQRVESGST